MVPQGEEEYLEWLADQRNRLTIKDGVLIASFTRQHNYPLCQFETWHDVITAIRNLEIALIDDPTARGWPRKRFLYLVATAKGFQIDVDEVFQPFEMFQLSNVSAIETDRSSTDSSSLYLKTNNDRWWLRFTRKCIDQKYSGLMEIVLPRVGYLGCFQTAYINHLEAIETLTSIVFTVPETTEWQAMPIDKRYGPYSRIEVKGDALHERELIKNALVSLMEGLEIDWRKAATPQETPPK